MSLRPITNNTPTTVEYLLFFPPSERGGRVVLPLMYRVGRIDDYPNRKPTHYMELPPLPEGVYAETIHSGWRGGR